MMKKKIKYNDIIKKNNSEEYEEIEKEETIRFFFTLAAIRLYEQKTGSKFFSDYGKAWGIFINAIRSLKINDFNKISIDKQLELTPILYDPTINKFLIDLIPCLYAEIHDGKYVQNEETESNAENSMWLMELVNIEFFTEIFQELSANQTKLSNKSGNSSKKV